MSRKSFVIWVAFTGLLVLLVPSANPVYAQESTPENDANCVYCHESQYYLYDSGKYFCLCEAPMHCIYCHGGRTDSYNKEIAHEGMTFYPTADHAARCKSCHDEDYMARVVKFDRVAGLSPSPRPMVTATAVQVAALPAEPSQGAPLLRLSQLEPWRQIGLIFVAFGVVAILILGYRCWKADCLAKTQS